MPEGRPPSRLGQELVGGLLGGLVGAGIGAGAGAAVGYVIARDERTGRGIITYISGFVGYEIGSAVGAFRVGDTPTETGSGFATLLGTCAGTVALGVPTLGVGVFMGAPLGAAIGFDLTRRYKEPPAGEEGFINMRGGGSFLALPATTVRCDLRDRSVTVYEILLFKASF